MFVKIVKNTCLKHAYIHILLDEELSKIFDENKLDKYFIHPTTYNELTDDIIDYFCLTINLIHNDRIYQINKKFLNNLFNTNQINLTDILMYKNQIVSISNLELLNDGLLYTS